MLENEQRVHFCGIVTIARLISQEDDRKIVSRMSEVFQLEQGDDDYLDLEIKRTEAVEQKYFSNMGVKNYRTWQLPESSAFHPPRAPYNHVVERGLEITGDFNDRYKYNQDADYYSGRDEAGFLINRGVSQVAMLIADIMR